MTDTTGFWLDEDPLREWILKAYHEKRRDLGKSQLLTEAVRELLSGAPGGPSYPAQYYFEKTPESSVRRFAGCLGEVSPGLDRAVYEPILRAIAEKEKTKGSELAPNLSLYVASISGPIALKTGVDETLVCALVSAALLTIARLGRKQVAEHLGYGKVTK